MKNFRVHYIFRKRGPDHNSIEELFQSIIANLPEHVEPNIVELPYGGANLKSIILNIWKVIFLKGKIHITGDVHYVGMIPFKNTILTIHDANIFKLDRHTKHQKKIIKWLWYVLPIFFVKKVTVISEFTKNQLIDICPGAVNKTEVIYNPVNPILEYSYKSDLASKPKVLHLGTKEHKNLINTVKALAFLECELIIVGNLSEKQKQFLDNSTLDYENYNNVNFNTIKELYELCDVVSFISFYEGFGMPIIEAQKVGRPIIASDRCSIPEVGGDGIVCVDPTDIKEITAGFERVFRDDAYRQQLVEKGSHNVKKFDMKIIVDAYCKLYKDLEAN